jgi:hypothetical protein
MDRDGTSLASLGHQLQSQQEHSITPAVHAAPPQQIWNMIPDMTDGFSRLSTAYQGFVSQNMNSVLGLHTAVFVLR